MAGPFAVVFYGVGSWDAIPVFDDEYEQEKILKEYNLEIYEEPYNYESVCFYIPGTLKRTEGDTGFLGKQLDYNDDHEEKLRTFVVEVIGEDPDEYEYGWWVVASPR